MYSRRLRPRSNRPPWNDPVLESDLLANAGMTTAHVTEFMRVFMRAADGFRESLDEADG
jgi:hypothetical protein